MALCFEALQTPCELFVSFLRWLPPSRTVQGLGDAEAQDSPWAGGS